MESNDELKEGTRIPRYASVPEFEESECFHLVSSVVFNHLYHPHREANVVGQCTPVAPTVHYDGLLVREVSAQGEYDVPRERDTDGVVEANRVTPVGACRTEPGRQIH